MVTQVLGSHNFLEVPTVNNDALISTLNASVPAIISGTFAAIPAAGIVGRLYLTTDTNLIYRDTGTAWAELMNGKQPVLRQHISGLIPALTSTTTIPLDNTPPLSTEGSSVWSQSFTPTNAASKIQIDFTCQVDSGTSNRMIAFAMFRNTTCIGVTVVSITTTARPIPVSMKVVDVAPGAGPFVYSCRAGVTGSTATWYINNNATAYFAGNLAKTAYSIQEFQ